jgi:ABC-type multidrug transport system ATPase subunit
LTVEEHLLFYARLKGISPIHENDLVNKAIGEVLLEKYRTFKV